MSTDKRRIRVSEVMVGDIKSIDALATVSDAAALMRRHSITSLVVNRRNADDEAGLIEVVGIAREVIARNRAPDRVHVYEVMTKPVVSLPATMLVRYAVRHLTALNLRRALVVDQERNVVGIVALRDMVLKLIAD